jgi:pectinesterase
MGRAKMRSITLKEILQYSLAIIIAICFSGVVAQDFPRDTSYTAQSAYQKYVKDYPEIEPADPALDDQVEIRENINYKNIGNRSFELKDFSQMELR